MISRNNKCTINRWQPPLINHNWVASRVLATRAALGTSIEARLRKIFTKMHGRQVLEFYSFWHKKQYKFQRCFSYIRWPNTQEHEFDQREVPDRHYYWYQIHKQHIFMKYDGNPDSQGQRNMSRGHHDQEWLAQYAHTHGHGTKARTQTTTSRHKQTVP